MQDVYYLVLQADRFIDLVNWADMNANTWIASGQLKQWLAEPPPFPGLFLDGLTHYLDGQFFEAHEVWEDLWRQTDPSSLDYVFYQGCIQLAVARYHASRGNVTGEKNLMRKAQFKFNLLNNLARYAFFIEEVQTESVYD
jgi:hypothetical protein